MFQIKLKSVNQHSLFFYTKFLSSVLNKANITFYNLNLPKKIRKLTLLKSPHVNKKAREQFQLKIYTISFFLNSSVNFKFLIFLLLNKPLVIKLSIKKF